MSVEQNGPKPESPRRKRKYRIVGVSAPSRVETVAATPPAASGEPSPEEMNREALARFSKSRHELIAELAYLKAERRGFQGGDPDRDWYEAELEVEELLRHGRPF